MDISITARGANVTDRFESYAEEKLGKVQQLLPNSTGIALKLCKTSDPHATASAARVEITAYVPGAVIRAESDGPDKYIAFDSAFHRIMERARRVHDRRTDRNAGKRRESLREASANEFAQHGIVPATVDVIERVQTGQIPGFASDSPEDEWSPVVIRSKTFPAIRMSVREAVDQMELVGHPFYLFVDDATGSSAVVYRRKGWSYGVLTLDENLA